MKTVVYFVRHSECVEVDDFSSDSLQVKNEKKVLSIEGEELARVHSQNKEFTDIDVVISSNYARAIGTSKYIAFNNNKKIIIDSSFGERKFGVNSYSEIEDEFYKRQWEDIYYKKDNGESLYEVQKRMYNGVLDVLDKYRGKKIVIVTHATSLLYLFRKWCDISYDGKYKIMFNNKEAFYGDIKKCETFKLVFDDDNKLLKIDNIVL